MKYGIRTPSVKRSISARTTNKVKRAVKSSINPTYGKKGMGIISNPKKSIYNKVYNKTTISALDKTGKSSSYSTSTTKCNSDVGTKIYVNQIHGDTDFSYQRLTNFNQAKLMENKKMDTESLYYYIIVLYYDANLDLFQQTIFNYKKYKYEKETLVESFEADICDFIAPGIIEKIKKLGTNYNNEMIDRIYKSPRLPYTFIEKNEFQQMIEEIISLDILDIKKYEKIIRANAKRIIDNI